ncbi:MAG TPA: hypothetical protein VJV05_15335 [Pyrinomonadaceae bacterium]|nr:hypothetical protein [Pyrinomonadaceae bacterium]
MRNTTLGFILLVAIFVAACGDGGSTPNTNTSNANVTSNANATANDSNALGTTKAPEAPTTNDAPTLGPSINAYYDALKRKDAAGVKKVMESQFLKSVESDMKDEKKTDIVAFLSEFDKLPEGKMEVRNETISGNKGTAEVKGGSYVNWTKVVFVKEDNVWKVSNEVPSPGVK